MGNIIDQAKKIAAENQATKQREQEAERANYKSLEGLAEDLWQGLLPDLTNLHGVANVRGKFHLQLTNQRHNRVRAFLWADGRDPEHPADPVAWVKAGVESVTVQLSDECQGEPYTTAYLTVRVYPPHRSHRITDSWDTAEREYYHNGGRTMSIRDPKDMVNLLAFLAEQLAPWVA